MKRKRKDKRKIKIKGKKRKKKKTLEHLKSPYHQRNKEINKHLIQLMQSQFYFNSINNLI